MSTTEVLIIGAGPFGDLSRRIFTGGYGPSDRWPSMNTWRAHMPTGMLLKSEPYASEIASPKGGYDLSAYYKLRGFDYINRAVPVSLERFLGYADWYVEQLVPNVRDMTAAEINIVNGAFELAFAGCRAGDRTEGGGGHRCAALRVHPSRTVELAARVGHTQLRA